MTNEINWSVHDKYPENTIECKCGVVYRSHGKSSIINGKLTYVTRKPCPGCGKSEGHVIKSSSDPEIMNL